MGKKRTASSPERGPPLKKALAPPPKPFTAPPSSSAKQHLKGSGNLFAAPSAARGAAGAPGPSTATGYRGATSSPGESVDRVKASDITPEEFWDRYVSARKPVILEGFLTDPGFKAGTRWVSDDRLIELAGEAEVLVERRASPGDPFGQGKRIPMQFGDLVRQLASGNDRLYLTSQALALAADGFPEFHAAPVTQLLPDVCMRPGLLGNLIPQQFNLWFGCAPAGSSSGLHHDYHDNLYVLVRGRKRFRLYSPDQAPRMYLNGKLTKVFPNGRIVYEGSGDVAADGSDAREAEHYLRRARLEEEVAAAEAAVASGAPGALERLSRAEAALESLMEHVLDAAVGDDSGGEWEDLRDDFDAQEAGAGAGALVAEDSEDKVPPHFSRVDMYLPLKEQRRRFPLFPGSDQAAVCNIKGGEMLYLPAGWFHEVQSQGASGPAEEAEEGPLGGRGPAAPGGVHLALNYWVHPPDNLVPASKGGFEHPYRSEFWATVFRRRQEAEARKAAKTAAATQPTAQARDQVELQAPKPKKDGKQKALRRG